MILLQVIKQITAVKGTVCPNGNFPYPVGKVVDTFFHEFDTAKG